MKPKRRRRAVSSSAMERSAVFMVPMTKTLAGTANGRPESGRWTSRPRLSFSSTVSSSPKMRGMSPRLISSMMRTKRSCGCAAASSHRRLEDAVAQAEDQLSVALLGTVALEEVLVAVGGMEACRGGCGAPTAARSSSVRSATALPNSCCARMASAPRCAQYVLPVPGGP